MTCSKRCYCIKCCIIKSLDFCCSLICVGVFCCLVMLAVVLFLIYLFYLAEDKSGTVVVGTIDVNSYDYNHEYPIMKRDLHYESADSSLDDYYYSQDADNEQHRDKRDKETTTTISTTTKKQKTSKPKTSDTQNYTDHASTEPVEETLDFKLSNSLVDSVFAQAESLNLKQPLGLCRKTADIKLPDFNVTVFPSEEAEEIISCINDILKNQTKKQLCIQLDPEMNAYVKWLVLTGDSKERRKQIMISAKDDFLFPSTCGTNESYHYEREGVFKMIMESSGRPIPGPPGKPEELGPGEIYTTCIPVTVNPKEKKKHH